MYLLVRDGGMWRWTTGHGQLSWRVPFSGEHPLAMPKTSVGADPHVRPVDLLPLRPSMA